MITSATPNNAPGSSEPPKNVASIKLTKTMAIVVAKFFHMLSAYLIVTATIKPPNARLHIDIQTMNV